MKGKRRAALFCALLILSVSVHAASESGGISSIRDLLMADKKAFSFRSGVAWGMTPEQVSAAEDLPMEQRTSSDWAVMITEDPAPVSRFTADLVYIFYQNALRMITYQFQKDCSTLNYQYLTGALSVKYGDSKEASPAVIKGWMDRIYQNYYRQDLIRNALEWSAEDGTSIYLYYYTESAYAILYVCPVSGGAGSYDTNGL